MVKRFLVMVLTIILFAVGFSWISYTPSSQREPNTYYFGFFETCFFVIIYAGPLYLFAGTPLSILIDKLIRKFDRKSKWKTYLFGLGMYSLAGGIVGILFIVISGIIDWNQLMSYSIIGLIASNLYFHLSLLLSKNNKDSII